MYYFTSFSAVKIFNLKLSENTVLFQCQKKSELFHNFYFFEKSVGASNPTFGQPKIYFYKFRCFWSNLNDDDNQAGENFFNWPKL